MCGIFILPKPSIESMELPRTAIFVKLGKEMCSISLISAVLSLHPKYE